MRHRQKLENISHDDYYRNSMITLTYYEVLWKWSAFALLEQNKALGVAGGEEGGLKVTITTQRRLGMYTTAINQVSVPSF